MNILILEYITGGGLIRESIPQSLAQEGGMMLRTLLVDLGKIDGVRLTVLRDSRLESLSVDKRNGNLELLSVNPEDEFDNVWKSAIQKVDAVWPIAPETGGVLEKLCGDVDDAGKILLNSPAKVVSLTAAKLQTLEHLTRLGIDIVPAIPLLAFSDQFYEPWVVKPNDGTGCEGVRVVRNWRELKRLQALPSAKEVIIQPFIEGVAMSLSVLFKQRNALLLCCNQQVLVIRDDLFFLSGCRVNSLPEKRELFAALACDIAEAIPDLFGYVGVDFILENGSPRVLEINPRLTTSYTGISHALNQNVAAMVLNLTHFGSHLPSRIESSGFTVDLKLGTNCAS